jgi:hypothetical protein
MIRNSGKLILTKQEKIIIFLVAMALFGICDLLTEVSPEFEIGPIELSVGYFIFIPLGVCILFDPLCGALGAGFGELIFSDLLMGEFGGLAELEGFIQLAIGLYVGSLVVRDPKNRKQIAIAVLLCVGIDQVLGAIVDISKVWIGVDELEPIMGLPKSIVVIEGLDVIINMIISGVFLGILPLIYLVPRLYGKIESSLGLRPRKTVESVAVADVIDADLIITSVFLGFQSIIVEYLAEADFNILVWEPEFLDIYGDSFTWVGVIAAGLVFIATIIFANSKKSNHKLEF